MSLFSIHFTQFDHVFCEASIYNNGSEYMNSATALFISFVGMFGLSYNSYQSINLDMLYCSLILNGVASSIYHHTHFIGWGLLDRCSMIYISTYCYNIFLELLITGKSKISHVSQLTLVVYLTYLSTITGLHNESLFNKLFGFFLCSMLGFLLLCRLKYPNIPKNVFNYGVKGVVYITVAGISWIITENLCDKYFVMKYLYGHSLWHIAVSLGGYYLSLIPIYVYKNDGSTDIKLEYKYNIPYIS